MSKQRVDNLYDVMDAAYDSPIIIDHSKSMGQVPLIDENPRRNKERKPEIELEQKCQRNINWKMPEDVRYNERRTVERVNGRLKDDFGATMVRCKGHAKVMTHLMFGVIALTVSKLMMLVE